MSPLQLFVWVITRVFSIIVGVGVVMAITIICLCVADSLEAGRRKRDGEDE